MTFWNILGMLSINMMFYIGVGGCLLEPSSYHQYLIIVIITPVQSNTKNSSPTGVYHIQLWFVNRSLDANVQPGRLLFVGYCVCVYIYIYIYIYVCVCVCVCVCSDAVVTQPNPIIPD